MTMREGTELLADHYQKTFELTLTVWEQRNRTFLMLLAVVGVATLLTFNVSATQPLLVDVIASILSIDDAARRAELRTSFPYGLIQSILLMVVLYLMLILYHRTTAILRNYDYLAAVEQEIRDSLELPASMVSFTREGRFYAKAKVRLAPAIGLAYVLMLFCLLVPFLGMRILTDFTSGQYWFGAIDIALAIPTLMFYAAYAFSSSGFLRRLFGNRL
jgi:hypothetical protein